MTASAALLARAGPDRGRVLQSLGGHSGAEVALCERGGQSFVRKTAMDRSANLRLRRQAIKQRLLAAQGLPFPAVLGIGQDAVGRVYFEMDYVPARTLAELVVGAAPFDHAAVLAAVARLVQASAGVSGALLNGAIFRDKLDAIVAQSRARPATAAHGAAIAALGRRLAARDWSGIPESAGHGDLTLENILISPGRGVVFIDCDEAWVSSCWLDLAKLFQDLEGHWCLRTVAKPSVDALERLSRLAGDLRAFAGDVDPSLPPRLRQIAALHLLRTLPYARDASVAAFVCASVVRLLEHD